MVPKNFWKDVESWKAGGGEGFCALLDKTIVSCAFSSGIHGNQLELGIETVPEFRGKGLAKIVSMHLVRYCLERGLVPVWCCRRSNVGSVKLALSLGFTEVTFPTGPIPYYHLPLSPYTDIPDYRKQQKIN